MRTLCGLEKDVNQGRSGIDAMLKLDDGTIVQFELKSTTTDSVTTVRDFGPDHIEKWKGKHWLIGFYDQQGKTLNRLVYATPEDMSTWIQQKAAYISSDFTIADLAASALSLEHMYAVCGEKEVYTLQDAKNLHKLQYKSQQYQQLMDVTNGYTPERMLQIFRERTRYLIKRGSTLNNPHIPGNHFVGLKIITNNHAATLKELVTRAIQRSNAMITDGEVVDVTKEDLLQIETVNLLTAKEND